MSAFLYRHFFLAVVLSIFFIPHTSAVPVPQSGANPIIDSLHNEFFKRTVDDKTREQISWTVFRMISQQFLYDEGVPVLQQFLLYAEQPKVNDTLKAAIYFQWALVGSYTQGAVLSRHTEYFLKARDLSAKIGNHSLLIAAYVQVMNNLYRAKAYEEAEQIGKEAVSLMETWDYQLQHVEIYNTLGLIYEKQKKLTQALTVFDKGIILIQRQDASNIWHGILQGNKGSVLHQMGRLQEAIPLLEFDVKTSTAANHIINAISSLSELAEINAQMGRMKEARANMDTVFQWIKITGDDIIDVLPACIKAYKLAAMLFQKEGKLAEAIDYLQKAHQKEKLYDELMQKNEAFKIRRQYDLERSEAALKLAKTNNDLLEQQKATREIIVMIAVTGLLLLLVLLLIMFRQRNKLRIANLQIEEQIEEIKQNNQQLQDLDRFKRLLTGTIVHDLKNPLAMMIQQTKEPLTMQAARRMMDMVINILEVDKLEDLHYYADIQAISLNCIVQQAFAQLSYQIEHKQLHINCLIPDNLMIQADAMLTERIFINLISNAVRFTPAGGNISIQLAPTPSSDAISVSVADTGKGIPPEVLPRIFDKFFQVNPNEQGGAYRSNGLGLTFCKLAMEAQNGSITVESTLHQGTTFFLTFPAMQMNEHDTIANYSQSFDSRFVLSAADCAYLQPFVVQLRQKELYELGEIRRILTSIAAEELPQVALWVSRLYDAAIQYNENTYDKLLLLVESASLNK